MKLNNDNVVELDQVKEKKMIYIKKSENKKKSVFCYNFFVYFFIEIQFKLMTV